jgi:hypothetical protein
MLKIENTQAETSFGFDYTLIELFINFFTLFQIELYFYPLIEWSWRWEHSVENLSNTQTDFISSYILPTLDVKIRVRYILR